MVRICQKHYSTIALTPRKTLPKRQVHQKISQNCYFLLLCLIDFLFFFSLCFRILAAFLFFPQGTHITPPQTFPMSFLIMPYFLSRTLLCFLISRIFFSISSILAAISAGFSLFIAFDSLLMISMSSNSRSFCFS